jgi:hypothetical protein
LDYFLARYYSSAQGRFTSPDAPFADQYVGDPQSWNLFAYVRNNPLRFIDPTGMWHYEEVEIDGKKHKIAVGDYDNEYVKGVGYWNTKTREWGKYHDWTPGLSSRSLGIFRELDRSANASLKVIGTLWGGSVLIGAGVGGGVYLVTTATTTGLDVFSLTGPPRALQFLLRASNGKLRNIIKALYRVTAKIGDGGTAASIEHTAETGELVGGSTHVQKGLDLIKGLGNVLKDPNLSQADREIATTLLNELKQALSKVVP